MGDPKWEIDEGLEAERDEIRGIRGYWRDPLATPATPLPICHISGVFHCFPMFSINLSSSWAVYHRHYGSVRYPRAMIHWGTSIGVALHDLVPTAMAQDAHCGLCGSPRFQLWLLPPMINRVGWFDCLGWSGCVENPPSIDGIYTMVYLYSWLPAWFTRVQSSTIFSCVGACSQSCHELCTRSCGWLNSKYSSQ